MPRARAQASGPSSAKLPGARSTPSHTRSGSCTQQSRNTQQSSEKLWLENGLSKPYSSTLSTTLLHSPLTMPLSNGSTRSRIIILVSFTVNCHCCPFRFRSNIARGLPMPITSLSTSKSPPTSRRQGVCVCVMGKGCLAPPSLALPQLLTSTSQLSQPARIPALPPVPLPRLHASFARPVQLPPPPPLPLP